MPPPDAVAGAYHLGPDGDKIQVTPLTAEDRRTLVRWIDLGRPIDGVRDTTGRRPQRRSLGTARRVM